MDTPSGPSAGIFEVNRWTIDDEGWAIYSTWKYVHRDLYYRDPNQTTPHQRVNRKDRPILSVGMRYSGQIRSSRNFARNLILSTNHCPRATWICLDPEKRVFSNGSDGGWLYTMGAERRRVADTPCKSHDVAKTGGGRRLSFLDTVAIGLSSIISDNSLMFIMGLALWTWEPRLGMLLAFAAGFTEWCNVLLKWWFQSPRPFWHMPGVTTPASAIEIDFSFPSSHVQSAVTICICLWPMLLSSSSTSRALSRSPATAALLSAVPCAIAWARVKVRAPPHLLSTCEPPSQP